MVSVDAMTDTAWVPDPIVTGSADPLIDCRLHVPLAPTIGDVESSSEPQAVAAASTATAIHALEKRLIVYAPCSGWVENPGKRGNRARQCVGRRTRPRRIRDDEGGAQCVFSWPSRYP